MTVTPPPAACTTAAELRCNKPTTVVSYVRGLCLDADCSVYVVSQEPATTRCNCPRDFSMRGPVLLLCVSTSHEASSGKHWLGCVDQFSRLGAPVAFVWVPTALQPNTGCCRHVFIRAPKLCVYNACACSGTISASGLTHRSLPLSTLPRLGQALCALFMMQFSVNRWQSDYCCRSDCSHWPVQKLTGIPAAPPMIAVPAPLSPRLGGERSESCMDTGQQS